MLLGRIASTLVLTWLADQLLLGHSLGTGAALWLSALVLALLAARVRRALDPRARMLAFALLGLAGSLALDPGPLAVALSLVGVATLALWVRTGADGELTVWAGRMAAVAGRAWQQPLRDLLPASRMAGRIRWERLGRGTSDWALPVALSAVFVWLFLIANPVLAGWWDAAVAALECMVGRLFGLEHFGRSVFLAVTGAAVWTLLRFRTRGYLPRLKDDAITLPGDVTRPETVVRCLVLFNLVFAIQSAVDLAVMLTGGGLPRGMTYAEYAHRGAYPLIATALLAGLFVTITFSSGQKAAEQRGARRLVFAWIAQNLVLLASTIWRHRMYVAAYGLTRWRLATIVWLGLVAAGFLLTARRIGSGRTNGWLVRANAAVLGGVLYACCFVDWSGMIARYDVAHVPAIDLIYMESLGPAALPALEEHRRRLGRAAPDVDIAIDVLRRERDEALADWRSWSVRAAEARMEAEAPHR